MALYTKCILLPPGEADGLRVSVMSRHTYKDGVTPDRRITPVDLHLPMLGPSPQLIGSYYREGLPWEEFAKKYRAEMREPACASYITHLAVTACVTNVTLLCIEREAQQCHRGILAELCVREIPRLTVIHR